MVKTESLDLKRKQRFEFMACLYDRTDGTEDGLVEIETVAEEIALSEGEAFLIAKYLSDEGLISLRLRHVVSMTHAGIVEVEAALRRPDTSTEHFPPLQSISRNGGSTSGTAVPSAGRNGDQPSTVRATELAQIRLFLSSLELQLPKLRLNEEETGEIQTDIHTTRVQLSSSKPKPQIVALCLQSILSIVNKAGTSVLTTDLQAQLPAIQAFLQRQNA